MTRAALIRALVEAAEALPELSSHAAIKAEMEVIAHAYALRRAKPRRFMCRCGQMRVALDAHWGRKTGRWCPGLLP